MSRLPASRLGQWIAFFALVLTPPSASAQSTYTWNATTTNNAWLDPANWTGGVANTFPGTTSAGLANQGHALDTAVIGTFAFPAANGLGIDFATANGIVGVGAIHLTAGTGGDLRIGNSSGTNGQLFLNKATTAISGVADVMLANTSGDRNLIIANTPGGSGSQTMTLVLGQTGGVFLVSSGGTITINSALSQDVGNAGFTVRGGGTVVLGAVNGFNGPAVVTEASTLSVSQDLNLGQVPGTATAGRIVLDNGTLNVTAGFALNANRGIALGPTSGTGSGTINVASGQTLTYGSGGIIADNPGGTGSLVKTGGGTLSLGGGNSYSGTTTVSAGVLAVTSNSGLGATGAAANTIVSGGAALQVSGTITVGEAITLNGTGISGGGALRKTGANTTTLSGVITLGAGGARINADAGTLTLTGGITGTGEPLTIGGAGNTTINGVNAIGTGGGTITKDGGGVLTIGNSNTWTGALNVNGGVVSIALSGNLGTTGLVTLNGGTLRNTNTGTTGSLISSTRGITLDTLGGTIDTPASGSQIIYDGLIGGTGGLTKTGAGALAVSNAGNNYQGSTTISGGILRVRGGNERIPNGTAVTVAALAAFDLSNNGTAGSGFTETVGSIAGAGSVTLGATGRLISGGDNSSTLFSGVISGANTTGGITKQGTGTLTLSGNNTYTGTTIISAGAIAVQHDNALGTAAGATTVSGGAALHLDGSGLSIAEPLSITGTGISGGGAVRNLANNNTLTGVITLTGNARINSDGGTLTIATGGVTGTTQTLTVGGAGNTAINAAVTTTTGGLTKDGTGTLTLNATNTYTGATAVNAGTLAGTGTVAGALNVNTGGTLTAGNPTAGLGTDPGTLTVGGDIAFNSGSNFRVRLTGGGASSGTPGDSSGGTSNNPANNGYLVQTAGTFTFDASANVVIDATGMSFTLGQPYSYLVGQSSAAVGLNVTDQTRFQTIGFTGNTFGLAADGTGAIFLTFTPVPEPATIFGIAAGALGLGGLLRRFRTNSRHQLAV
jgi:autotransporter-associated beta strand protein